MNIGIDLDNTITDLPEFFSVISKALVETGHEVHIITYRVPGTEDEVRTELQRLGIRFTRLHLPQTLGSAPAWKADLVAQLGIEIMVEDSPEVLAGLPSSVQRLWVCDPAVFDLDICLRALRESS